MSNVIRQERNSSMGLREKVALDFDIVSELESGFIPFEFQLHVGSKRRILAETSMLSLLPTVSPLLVGHVLVFSKLPFLSFADLLQQNSGASFELLHLINEYEARFGKSLLFEHGSSKEQGASCGVSRAHVHLVPSSEVDFGKLLSAVSIALGAEPIVCSKLMDANLCGREYLSMMRPGAISGSWFGGCIPSQLVRRLIAEQVGSRRWDWKELFGWEIVRETMDLWSTRRSVSHAARRQSSVLYA